MAFAGPIAVVAELPLGGLGQLFRCRDATGLSFVAKFPKDHSAEAQALLRDEERRLRRHQGKHVVKYMGAVRHADGRSGFAMEPMEGSLAELLASRGRFDEVRAIQFLAGAVAGLLEIQRSGSGAFHGDIKLGNILHAGGVAKLADFGLARGGAGQTLMAGPHQGGTPGYFPPEGFASVQGDVFSLGVALWGMLSGREPRPGEQLEIPGNASPGVSALLADMLVAVPSRRITAQAVAARLPGVLAEAQQLRRERWLGRAAALAALGALGLLTFGLFQAVARARR